MRPTKIRCLREAIILHPWLSKMHPASFDQIRIFARYTCLKVRFLQLRFICAVDSRYLDFAYLE